MRYAPDRISPAWTRGVHYSQEQQHRIRLAENESNAKKPPAESVKSIRLQMTLVEEEVGDLRNWLIVVLP
ncbi:MAG: hypothetical protein WCL08_06115 [Verrucomicrobiota bacterium]